jgi:hypothetical protein
MDSDITASKKNSSSGSGFSFFTDVKFFLAFALVWGFVPIADRFFINLFRDRIQINPHGTKGSFIYMIIYLGAMLLLVYLLNVDFSRLLSLQEKN